MNDQLYRDLTWDDLSRWAGATILERGIRYKCRVFDLSAVGDNHLIATVEGRYSYRTEVWFEDDELKSRCDCPFSGPCKHAVAVILEALEFVKAETPIPVADLHRLDPNREESADTNFSRRARIPFIDAKKVRAALVRIPTDHLIDWATKQIMDNSEKLDDLPHGIVPEDFVPDNITVTNDQIASIRNLIQADIGPRFDRYHRNYEDRRYGHKPDFHQIQIEFHSLARIGRINELIELGEELFTLAIDQFNETNPDSEFFEQLSGCVKIVVDSMRGSAIPLHDQVIKYCELTLLDDYNILGNVPNPVRNEQMHQDDWILVAQHFTTRLKSVSVSDAEDSFSAVYRRNQILERAIDAFKAANAIDQALELMESELPNSDNYVDLVDLLIQTHDFERAKQWIVEGHRKTKNTLRGTAHRLAEKLYEIAKLEGNQPQMAALAAYFFIQYPSIKDYEFVRDACQIRNEWKEIRSVLLKFLETGVFDPAQSNWPLPETGLGTDESIERHDYPDYDTLIDIALEENRLDGAMAWYRRASNHYVDGLKIASATKESQPNAAVEIWQNRIEYLIRQVNAKAYLEAMPLLREIKELLRKEERSVEFDEYIEDLRTKHKKKRRLLREIDLVQSSHRRILDS